MGCSGWGDGEGWGHHHHQNQTLRECPSSDSFDQQKHLSSAEKWWRVEWKEGGWSGGREGEVEEEEGGMVEEVIRRE